MSIEHAAGIEKAEPGNIGRALELYAKRDINAFKERIAAEHRDKHYHNLAHTETVAKISEEIFDVIKKHDPRAITTVEEYAREYAAWGHDLKINADIIQEKGIVSRRSGWENDNGNEWQSYLDTRDRIDVALAQEEVRCEHEDCPPGYLAAFRKTVEEIQSKVGEAIKGTIPAFDLNARIDPDALRAFGFSGSSIDRLKSILGDDLTAPRIGQEHVGPDAGITTLAVAMADLSQAGRLQFDDLVEAGNGEFRELNYIVDGYGARIDALSDDEAQELYARYMAWSKQQVGFIFFQWQRFETLLEESEALNGLANAWHIKKDLRKLFGNFEKNMKRQMDYAEGLEETYGPETPEDRQKLKRFYEKEILQKTN